MQRPDDLIDFPCSPTWAAAYAEQGLTPPLPAGFPVDPPAFEPLPITPLNEAEWKDQGAALLELIGWVQHMASTYTPDEWHNHLPDSSADVSADSPLSLPPLVPEKTSPQPLRPRQEAQPAPTKPGGWKAN